MSHVTPGLQFRHRRVHNAGVHVDGPLLDIAAVLEHAPVALLEVSLSER
jgi:hypothetical protein